MLHAERRDDSQRPTPGDEWLIARAEPQFDGRASRAVGILDAVGKAWRPVASSGHLPRYKQNRHLQGF